MSQVTQKEAVYQAVCNVTGFNGEGVCEITSEQRKQVNAILFEGFKSGKIQIETMPDDAALKGYVSGLQSNWLRKDTRLNGGMKYTAKNPGSRAGSSDPSLKAMRALLSTVKTDAERAEIQGFIDQRVSELSISKQTKTVDFSALPAELAAKFSK